MAKKRCWLSSIASMNRSSGLSFGRRRFALSATSSGGDVTSGGLDPGAQVADVDLRGGTDPFEIGCYGTFFLSRMDLQALDEYAQNLGI